NDAHKTNQHKELRDVVDIQRTSILREFATGERQYTFPGFGCAFDACSPVVPIQHSSAGLTGADIQNAFGSALEQGKMMPFMVMMQGRHVTALGFKRNLINAREALRHFMRIQ